MNILLCVVLGITALFLMSAMGYVFSLIEINKIESFERLEGLFENKISDLIDFYLQERGTYDFLIQNTDINTEEYFEIHKDAADFIIKNIPKELQRKILRYMNKDQYFMYISQQIYRHLNELYIRPVDETDIGLQESYTGNIS